MGHGTHGGALVGDGRTIVSLTVASGIDRTALVHMFAAAPDLLAALEDALPFLQDHAEEVKNLAASWPENPDGPGAAATAARRVERARAAIAKAGGK